MVVEIHPDLADWLAGLVFVVEILKSKFGISVIMHSVCMCVYWCIEVSACYDNLPILVCCLAWAGEVSWGGRVGVGVAGVASLLVGDCCCDDSLSMLGACWLSFCIRHTETLTKIRYVINIPSPGWCSLMVGWILMILQVALIFLHRDSGIHCHWSWHLQYM